MFKTPLTPSLILIVLALPIFLYSQDYKSLFQSADVSSDLPALHNSTLFKADSDLLQKFYADKNNQVSLIIPYAEDRVFELMLEEKQIFTDSYTLSEKNGVDISVLEQVELGRYFFGSI